MRRAHPPAAAPDGGWNIYEGGPSEVNATVKAYFALKLAGHRADAPWMHEARACILRLGGIPRMNTYAKLYLALLGQFPWKYLPTVPVEIDAFSRSGSSSISTRCLRGAGRCSCRWPSSITSSRRATCPAEGTLHELYPAGTEQADLRLRAGEPALLYVAEFLPRAAIAC